SVSRGGAPRVADVSVGGGTSARGWARYAFAAAAGLVAFAGLREWQARSEAVGRTQVLATKVGQRDSLTLSDGSRILLAPGSRVTVAAGFSSGDRTVILEGAAYFDVTHDDAHPFTVRAAGAEIRDIGTSFTVKTDATGGVSVAVTHGTVALREAVSSTPTAVELHAGDRGLVSAGSVAVTRGTVTEDEMAWTRGQLTYRDAPLSEVQADLKRWYGINLVVSDSALFRYTITIPVQQDSATVVSTIAAMIGADTEQRGDTVILRSAGRGTIP
ncbi:MAG: FecR domain-containing protein, partial [Gemmatimonas sp.]